MIASGIVAFFIAYFLFIIAIVVFMCIVRWKIYVKAGYEGWEAIIPIYSFIVLLKIVGKPWWWIFMMIIPVVNIVFAVWTVNMLSKSFGKDEGFTAGLIFLGIIFYPILGFGSAKYVGPYGDPNLFNEYRNRNQQFDFNQQQLHS